MGSFDDFVVGQTFATPTRDLDEAVIAGLISEGGYTHPLFSDPEFGKSGPLGGTPLPGEGLLLLMGGLLEQSERFDDSTLALTGFSEVAFKKPALPGQTIRVEAEVLGKDKSSSGSTGIVDFSWTCVNQYATVLCTAKARMLFRLEES